MGLAVAGSRGLWLHHTSLQDCEKTAVMDMPLSLSGLFGERAIALLEDSSRTGVPAGQATRAPWSPRLRLQLSRQQISSHTNWRTRTIPRSIAETRAPIAKSQCTGDKICCLLS